VAEGQAVRHWAEQLRSLVGEKLVNVSTTRRWAEKAMHLQGQWITGVAVHGKHLLIHLSGGMTVHCHALMYGSWQVGLCGMALHKDIARVRLRLTTERHEAVFYNGPVVEFLASSELHAHPKLSALGPDILDPDFDAAEAVRRLQRATRRVIGEAILDQTVISGVGNIYKSEGLFLAGIHPVRPVGELAERELASLWRQLGRIMGDGIRTSGRIYTLHPALRTTGSRFWVYRRAGQPCFVCGETVRHLRQGSPGRSTYCCAGCQPHQTAGPGP
jgi:DNA-formamidopyrimidine glycosylase